MSFAITYTVKNEARLLLDAIAFHRYQGCSLFYIFFDGTTDEAPALLAGVPDVICRPTVHPHELDDSTDWYLLIKSESSEWFDLRKKLNTFWAAKDAQSKGIDWIGALDPDELITASISAAGFVSNQFNSFLSTIPLPYVQLRLLNLDNIPVSPLAPEPFTGSDLFLLRRNRAVEEFWRISRAFYGMLYQGSANQGYYKALYDQIFFKILLGNAFPREIKHPHSNSVIPTGIFLSYYIGKVFVRTSALDWIRPGIHFWQSLTSRPIRTKTKGHVLHYDFVDASYFIHKFKQRPHNTDVSTVRSIYVRWAITRLALDLSDQEAERFFTQNIVIQDPSRQQYLIDHGVLARIPYPKLFFNSKS
jgi:hypothetical protein